MKKVITKDLNLHVGHQLCYKKNLHCQNASCLLCRL